MMEKVVIVFPAYNAANTLRPVIHGLRGVLPEAQIIGVNDGSTDDTGVVLKGVCDCAIDFDVNRGKGQALQVGFAAALAADCTAVLTIDSDGQHDPVYAPSLLSALDRAHISIGTRDLTGQQVPKHRRIANFLSSSATRLVSGGAVRDSQSGYRAFRREVLEEVHAVGDRYEYETDFIVRSAHAGFTITNIPISTIYGPQSYFREFHDAMRVIGVLWGHRSGVFRHYVPRPLSPRNTI